jgi:hypothetical protein
MNKRIVGLLFAVALLVAPAWGIQVGCQDYMTQVGVRLATGEARVEFADGQTMSAEVVNVATLARHGLKGIKKGDAVQVTHIKDSRFKLMHVPSGRAVEITYRPK